jgi:hypothetical protein
MSTTTAALTPAAGSPEETAWSEIQAWYNRLLTAAPKPDASRPHVNVGNLIRWCESWDIDTADIEAICEKHKAFEIIRPFASPFPKQ